MFLRVIKGLLKKSKKREQQQSPPKDTRNKSPYSNRSDMINNQNNAAHMRKNPLLCKVKTLVISLANPLDKPRKELPPVDTKSVKNFNKKPLGGKAQPQQDQYFMKQNFYDQSNFFLNMAPIL
jgi:hypothetical protein